MSWIHKILPSGINRSEAGKKRATVPEGVWTKCIKCEAVLYRPDLERNADVCPKCDHHMRLGARRRLDLFLDKENREEVFKEIEPIDRLRFRDKKKYTARLAAAQRDTGERDALVAMRGTLHGMPVVTVAFEFKFHGGSMGQAVGEKFSRAAQLALKERIPLVCFAASGGARMQEALISLMQMAKTSAVIERMHAESVPYISVLTDPIYGGVSASLALLGDLNIAEPEVRAGFAGPNIIEQTIRQKLPKGFQRSEFLLEHGAIDMIVHRLELRDTIARVLAKLTGAAPIAALQPKDSEEEAAVPPIGAVDDILPAGDETVDDAADETDDADSAAPTEEASDGADEDATSGGISDEAEHDQGDAGADEEPRQAQSESNASQSEVTADTDGDDAGEASDEAAEGSDDGPSPAVDEDPGDENEERGPKPRNG